MKALGKGFVPGPKDVICGRGKAIHEHQGNVIFRNMIEEHLGEYSEATMKHEKSMIVSVIVDKVRRSSPRGGFVRQGADNCWYEVGDGVAREKVGQR